MKILAHRGFWKKPEEKNSEHALLSAIENNWGIETDVRDLNGTLVISHDMPKAGALELHVFLSHAEKLPAFREVQFAWNIKSDGLHEMLDGVLKQYGIESNSFFFDMSVPVLCQFAKKFPKKNLCARISDFEPFPPSLADACGWIWVDGFASDFSDFGKLAALPHNFAFVSPEIHLRPHLGFWKALAGQKPLLPRSYLCTDLPQEAREALSK